MSLTQYRLVTNDMLQQRLETVKQLTNEETQMYEVVKDRETGEHYLHYSYLHIRVAEGNLQEVFHQLLPLPSDEVLGIVLGEQPYTYPDYWNHAYLRNGPEGHYVWFDPTGADQEQEHEQLAQQLKQMLTTFKQQGNVDAESIQKLLDNMDKLGNKE